MDDDSCRATCQTNVNNKISTVSATESVTITRTVTQNAKLKISLPEHNYGSHLDEKRHQCYWMPRYIAISA